MARRPAVRCVKSPAGASNVGRGRFHTAPAVRTEVRNFLVIFVPQKQECYGWPKCWLRLKPHINALILLGKSQERHSFAGTVRR
jgi:hypothetical protein